MNSKLEKKIKDAVLTYLQKGRPGWSIPHTLTAVYWMKQLLKTEKGDGKILITATYLHDIGDAEVFNEKNSDFDSQLNLKGAQMKQGAAISKKLLNQFAGFTKYEINQIVHLVRIHDNLPKIKTPAEQLLFEADSLGQIDRKKAKGTFSKSDYKKFLASFKKLRIPRFKTKTGKKFLLKLFKEAKN